MSVFKALTKEHRLFERLLDELLTSLNWPEEQSRSEVQKTMLVLLPALEQHERLEDEILDAGRLRADAMGRRLQALIRRQHRALVAIKDEIREGLQDAGSASFDRLRSLVTLFASGLRGHFSSEERELWPWYQRSSTKPMGPALEKRAEELVRTLEEDVKRRRELVEEALDPRRR